MTWGHKVFVKPQLMTPNYFLKPAIEKLVTFSYLPNSCRNIINI